MNAVVGALAAMLVLSTAAFAQERMTGNRSQFAPEAQAPTESGSSSATRATPKALIAEGYEIKTVTVVPHDIVLRGGSTIDVDAVVIMLQNGAKAAQCYMTYQSYVNGSYFGGEVPSCAVFE